MEIEERLEEIKNKIKKSNKYTIFVDYDDIKFLIYIIEMLQKRINLKPNKFIELKTEIEKNILDELEKLTRNCINSYDIDKIKILSESYKNIKGE